MLRRFLAVVGSAGVMALSGCVAAPWSAPEQPRPAAGARVVDGRLELWLGASCPGVTAVHVTAKDSTGQQVASWEAEAADPGGAFVERIVVGGDNRELRADSSSFNWNGAEVVDVEVGTASRDRAASGYWTVKGLTEGGGPDEWLVQDRGWVTEQGYAELAASDGLHPVCEVPGITWPGGR